MKYSLPKLWAPVTMGFFAKLSLYKGRRTAMVAFAGNIPRLIISASQTNDIQIVM